MIAHHVLTIVNHVQSKEEIRGMMTVLKTVMKTRLQTRIRSILHMVRIFTKEKMIDHCLTKIMIA